MRRFGLSCLLAFAMACRPSSSDSNAKGVVEQFYAATLEQRVTGAPTTPQLAALAPFLSDTLHSLLAAARQRSDTEAARDPHEKPSFADGNLFSSLFEGPNAVEVIADSARGAVQVATVRMISTGATPPITWVDRVLLTRRDGHYVIDDVEYGGTWDFANRGNLRATLAAALAAPP